MTPGERQTVEVIEHPKHGLCKLVYRHGPAFLLQDGNTEPIPLVGGAFGGCKAGEGSYVIVTHPGGEMVKCKVITHGDKHDRFWSPMLGEGWLVFLSKDTAASIACMRFDADDGRSMEFEWTKLSVGTPEYAAKMERARTRCPEMTPEESKWETFTTPRGEVLAFRRDGPPPPDPEPEESQDSRQTELPL
jgi:hypothetical protein